MNRERGGLQQNFYNALKGNFLYGKECDVHVIEQSIKLFKEELSKFKIERYKPFGVKFVIGFVLLYFSTIMVVVLREVDTWGNFNDTSVLLSKIIYAISVVVYFANLFWSIIITFMRKKEYRYREMVILLEEIKLNYIIHFSKRSCKEIMNTSRL